MTNTLITLLGGIGLFLLGMHMMTDALKRLASRRARQSLARFTKRPLSGAVTGALTTAAVQSSTATMVTTVGFVGAGLITFQQALGILYGASIGTTVTGWIVLLAGFRLQLTAAAMPLLFLAVLVHLFARGTMARVALSLAGLALVFLGIDMMQDGLEGYEDQLTPQSFPPATTIGRLQLVGIGILVTVITQSSSAGVAGTLVLLGTGAVTFEQAAAMVIGMHIGTTSTPLLAAIGGSPAMRQTAVANVIYHLVTGLLALAFIDLGARLVAGPVLDGDRQLGLVIFHTGFNLIGTAVMLPLTARFAAAMLWLMPEMAAARPTARLDRALLSDPGAALDTAGSVLRDLAAELFGALSDTLAAGTDHGALARARERIGIDIEPLEEFLSHITVDAGNERQLTRYNALLHQLDHLRRLHFRCGQGARIRTAVGEPSLRRHIALLRATLRAHGAGKEDAERRAARLDRLERRLGLLEARTRHLTRSRPPHVLGRTPTELFQLADALRWMRRSTRHAERIITYQGEAHDPVGGPDPADAPEALEARPAG